MQTVTSELLIAHDRKPCPYCGKQMLAFSDNPRKVPTRDHIRPARDGGIHTLVCCSSCNNDKGGHSLIEWSQLLASEDDRRLPLVKEVIKAYPELSLPRPRGAVIEWDTSDMPDAAPAKRKPWVCTVCRRRFKSSRAGRLHAEAINHYDDWRKTQSAMVAGLSLSSRNEPQAPEGTK